MSVAEYKWLSDKKSVAVTHASGGGRADARRADALEKVVQFETQGIHRLRLDRASGEMLVEKVRPVVFDLVGLETVNVEAPRQDGIGGLNQGGDTTGEVD